MDLVEQFEEIIKTAILNRKHKYPDGFANELAKKCRDAVFVEMTKGMSLQEGRPLKCINS